MGGMPSGGHLGLILNRPTGFSLSTIFPQHAPSKVVRDPIHLGGPFSSGSIVALLPQAKAPGAGAVQLGEQLYLAYDAKLIDHIIEQTPNDARYFAGLVIWRPDELRLEIDRGLWTLHPADTGTLFRRDTDRLWLELVRPVHDLRTQAPLREPAY